MRKPDKIRRKPFPAKIKAVALALALFLCGTGQAQQIPTGTWRAHRSYNNAKHVALTPDKVFCATANGMFWLDKPTSEIFPLGKEQGLSGAGITALNYLTASSTLCVVYRNGNVDLIRDGKITNSPAIADSEIADGKETLGVFGHEKELWVLGEFGVAKMDSETGVVNESYLKLGPQGVETSVFAGAILGEKVYLATSHGVIEALRSGNLQDFRSWTPVNGLPDNIRHIAKENDKLFFAGENSIWLFSNNALAPLTLPATPLRSITSGEKTIVCAGNGAWTLGENGFQTILKGENDAPSQAFADNSGKYWLADERKGLVSDFEGEFRTYTLSGLADDQPARIFDLASGTVSLPQKIDGQASVGFSLFENGLWTNLNPLENANIENVSLAQNISDIAINQNDEIALASNTHGLVIFDKNNKTFRQVNAGLPSENGVTNVHAVSETGLDGTLWAIAGDNQAKLYSKKAYENWTAFTGSIGNLAGAKSIVTAPNEQRWIYFPNGNGIIVVDNENKFRFLGRSENHGALPSANINDLVFDRSGFAWVATNSGVAYITNVWGTTNNEAINATRPVNESLYLFENKKVHCLAVDGGDRKWFGTDEGLWLFDKYGEELIKQFTSDNSFLPSNKVLDLSIDHSSGEVFVLTDAGLVSYRSDATAGNSSQPEKIKVFPNPVRPNYSGLVTISDLVTDARVKITDASGRLVYETRANGGTCVWNTRDYTGRAVKTGIYLILVTNDDGSETAAGKVAVIR
ncbi:hypothetical protein FUAX_25390 [Fulvitalea axinellae]|uniref:PorZ N-terminal beta-propeller domain-containing protein n=1 Tax=Fulvitalea axinellae TaxID=1182444 RepID=A0AAU9CQ73_9BACT|nr:hypothetical protein FUAX_25390 [Fulvitalea axinellae]